MAERPLERSEAIVAREELAVGSAMKIRFYPFVPAEAQGTRIRDADGNEYVDMIAAAGVVQTGYRHPQVRDAIVAELDRTWSNMHCVYPNERTTELAEELCARLPGDFPKKAIFGTTGSDANDALFKLVPLATGRPRMISFVGAYHGQTSGSSAISGHQTMARIAGPGTVTKVPYPYPYRCAFGPCSQDECSLKCLRFIEDYALGAVSPADQTAAIIMEAVQSDGGDVVPPENFIPALRETCDRHGIWLVFDEVKTGLGRTGRFFAFQHSGVQADAISLGKPLGGGLPLSAVVGRAELGDADAFALSTLGGSPVPSAGGLATLRVIDEEHLVERAEQMGKLLLDGLRALQASHLLIGEVRGRGLMLGFELVTSRETRAPATADAARFVYRCFELGLLVIYCGALGNVIEMTPPLTIEGRDVDDALTILDQALSDIEAGRFDDSKLARYAGW